jgi:hypothetical protein
LAHELKEKVRPVLVTGIELWAPRRPEIVIFVMVSKLNWLGNVILILHPWFKGTGLLKLTCIMLVSPTIPATVLSVEGSTEKADWVIGAGSEIFKVVAVVISICPPA